MGQGVPVLSGLCYNRDDNCCSVGKLLSLHVRGSYKERMSGLFMSLIIGLITAFMVSLMFGISAGLVIFVILNKLKTKKKE